MNAPSKMASAPPQAAAVTCPVDHAHLARFTLGNRALETEVLQLFVGHLPVGLGQLRAAAVVADWRMAAHSLKGSARAVGAWRLAQLAEEAERFSEFEAAEARENLLAEIEMAAAEATRYIGCFCNTN